MAYKTSANIFLYIFLSIGFALPNSAKAQELAPRIRDSIVNIVCDMVAKDKLYRTAKILDSVHKARETGDSATVNWWVNTVGEIDRANFKLLEDITRQYGYPGRLAARRRGCFPTILLIHWSKGYPEWFNSPANIRMFQEEIRKGHLSQASIDQAIFFYVSFTDHGLEYFEIINSARKLYGLKPYTTKQFLKQEWIEPMKRDRKRAVVRNTQ